MTAPPPEDPDGSRDPRDLDFDAEFERIIADWQPSPPDPSGEPEDPSVAPEDPSVEPVETPGDPTTSVEPPNASVEPPKPSVEPVETPPGATNDDNLRDLFRQAWPDEDEPDPSGSEHAALDDEEHFVPPPAPPVPRPEPRRLLAWAGLMGAPMVALVFLLFGTLPSWASFLLFCWFVGGFGYLIGTMGDGDNRDGWDDGARV
jgi:hypothetical protein